MLDQSRVLDYIKRNLGFPFSHLELSDTEIIEYVTTHTIRTFSKYIPWVQNIPMNLTLESLKVPERQNEFLIPAGSDEILNVRNVYFTGSDLYFFGHPYLGPLSYDALPDFALQVHKAMSTKMFSSFDKTIEFRHPNVLRISPVPTNTSYITVECELVQPADLSQVPNEFQDIFCELSLADIMIALGRIRAKYGGQLRTPFGEIPINAEILEEGKTMRRELIEKLETVPVGVIIDFG